MPQRIQPTHTKVITKDGECVINLTLDININLNSAGLSINGIVSAHNKEEVNNEQVSWAIPEFKNEAGTKLKFGKKEKKELEL